MIKENQISEHRPSEVNTLDLSAPRAPGRTEPMVARDKLIDKIDRILSTASDDNIAWALIHLDRVGTSQAKKAAEIIRAMPQRTDAPPVQQKEFYRGLEQARNALRK